MPTPDATPTSLHVCRFAATRLAASGAPLAGATSRYVTDSIVSIDVNVDADEGETREIVSGCNAKVVTYREPDTFNGYTFSLELGSIEPRLLELMTGQGLLMDTDTPTPHPRGLNFPTAAMGNPPDVAIEVWSEAWEDASQVLTPYRYLRRIYPKTRWRVDDATYENDFTPETLVGYSMENPGWGVGLADQGGAIAANGALLFADTLPTPAKTYVTVP